MDDRENAHANNDASEKAIFFKMLTSIPTDRKRNTRAQTAKCTRKQPTNEKTAIEAENDDENKANNKDSNRDYIYIPATPTENTDKQGLKKIAPMENATARPQNPSEPEKRQRKTSKKTHNLIRPPTKTHGDDGKSESPRCKKTRTLGPIKPNMRNRPPDDAVR